MSDCQTLKHGGLRAEALSAAIGQWTALIGTDHVLTTDAVRDRYARSALPQGTRPLAVLRPGCADQVQEVVRVAARHRIPIYPISCGKNWGLGEACAVTDGQVIVDLGRLNRIAQVNVPLAYAVVEPGVTQRQMHEHLRANDIPLWFDATGAGPDASIVGNIMERGYGHTPLGDRFHNSCGYEVILGDGRKLNTGFGHYEASQVTHVFKAGIGPSLDGLFTQSNFGIVVRMGIWLMPKPSCFEAFVLSVPEAHQLGEVIEALRPLRISGVLQSTIHIANDLRIVSSHQRYPWERTGGKVPLPPEIRKAMRLERGLGAWNVLGGLYGTAESVRAAKSALRRSLRSLARPKFINDRKIAFAEQTAALTRRLAVGRRLAEQVAAIKPAYALLKGQPVADHLAGTAWRSRSTAEQKSLDPLDNGDGLMWLTPVVPMTGDAALDLQDLVEPIYQRHGFEPLLTFVMVTGRAMCAPITVCYDKQNAEETRRAADCYDALFEAVMKRGYIPYRTGIRSMPKLADGSRVFWDVAREIKSVLDPQGILAPGRYSP